MDDLLDGWKAIADHLGKTERTVQRWEKSKGLPVRRLQADSPEEQPRVFAYKSEIDSWWKDHQTRLKEGLEKEGVGEETGVEDIPPAPRFPRRAIYVTIALVVTVAIYVAWPRIQSLLWPHEKVLGVMPVRNLSGAGDPEPQHLAEALTELMVTQLGRLQPKNFRVIQLAPSPSANTAGLDYLLAGPQRAGLDYILTGSVQRAGRKVVITAQLGLADQSPRSTTSSVIWGKSYERNLKDPEDMIPIEIEITDATVNEILPLLPHGDHPPKKPNPDAYEAYLWGRMLWDKRTPDNLFQAITYFQRAIGIEPTYAPAYAGLADCYFLLGSVPYTALPPGEAFPKAEANAQKALELDGSLAEAHISLGYSALVYRRDFAESEKQFQKALRLRPEYAPAHHFYAYLLTAIGRINEAISERQKARSLEPLSPIFNAGLGEAYYQGRRFNLAIQENQKSLLADPQFPDALMNIARVYEQQGSYAKAEALLQKILNAAPEEPAVIAMAGHEYAVSGRPAQARAMISKLQDLSKKRYVSPLYFALVYIGLADKNEAFRWLNQAYDERSDYLVYLRSEPWTDPLRSDPRFAAFINRLGFPAGLDAAEPAH